MFTKVRTFQVRGVFMSLQLLPHYTTKEALAQNRFSLTLVQLTIAKILTSASVLQLSYVTLTYDRTIGQVIAYLKV